MSAVPANPPCAACGSALPPGAKFCPECAQPVHESRPPGAFGGRMARGRALEGELKLVTVLFADLKGSIELMAERDPEEARRFIDPVLEHMCDAVEKYGGTVSQVMGDGIMALFGAPLAAEDHAVRACFAALAMQDLVRHYGEEALRTEGVVLQIRVGLNSGEAVLSETRRGLHSSYTAIGFTVHVASRMERMAKPGSVLATADTARLAEGYVEARGLGAQKVKGVDEPIEVVEIARMATTRLRFDTTPARAITPFVGRERETATLNDVLQRVLEDGKGRWVSVVGDAGIGKSRLTYEFLRSLARRDVLALDGGAAPYGSGAVYRPGVHILRQYFHLGDNDDAQAMQQRVAGRILALGGGGSSVAVPLLFLLRALPEDHRFHALSPSERRLRVFEALIWVIRRITAERPLVLAYEDLQWVTSDTRDFLHELVRDLPPSTLVVLTYRTDYDAAWLGEPLNVVRLEGLAGAATERVATELLGDDRTLAALKGELAARSGGNPLFVEEHVRSMIEAGELVGEARSYRLGKRAAASTIPHTVRAVLAARIDRLPTLDKHVLQAVAAVGEAAAVSVLDRVIDLGADEIRKSLRRLEQGGLVLDRTEGGELVYEFKHSLTQAVAYETLLRARRRELHLRILGALADKGSIDVLARHAVLSESWREALDHLRAAGLAAASQFANIEAVDYLERAIDAFRRLPASDQSIVTALELHCELRNALVPLGRHERILQVLSAAETIAREGGDERRLAQIMSFLENCYGNIGRSDLALAAGERALALAERADAHDLLIVGNLSVGEIYRTRGDYRRARDHLRRTIELIDRQEERDFVGQAGLPSVRARSHLAWTLAELGEFDEALAVAEQGVHIAEASNHSYTLSHAALGLGGTLVRRGEFQAAIPVLLRGYVASERVPLLRPPIAADLGVAYARTGNHADGLSHLHAAIERARAMGRLSRLPLMLVKCAEIHLLTGDLDECARLGEMALALANEQKERGNQVYAVHLLAKLDASRQTRDGDERAERGYKDALDLASELGMSTLMAHCRAGLGRLCLRRGRVEGHALLKSAMSLYGEMNMRFWLEPEAESMALA